MVKRPANPAELTRLYTDEAITFIEKNKEQPFFLYLPHTMLHNPLGVSDQFKGSSQWGEYGDAIEELGLAKNTIVIYASDNGRGPGRNAQQPIKGTKLSTYEGGLRVPAIAWGPGMGIRTGHVCAAVVHAMDWYPTLATLAGIEIPSGPILDGRDLSSLLTGKTDKIPPPSAGSLNSRLPLRRPWNPPAEWATLVKRAEYQNAFFYHGSQGTLAAVRSGPWKLFLNPKLTLYNLANDPGERKPVVNRQMLRKLRGMAVIFQEEMRRDARPAGEVTLLRSRN